MKCPKCGYISFDHNQACPKCNRDISQEQAKLNILPFAPNPPSLLGILTGETGAQVGLGMDSSGVLGEAVAEEMAGLAVGEEPEMTLGGMDESVLDEEESLGDFELEGDVDEEIPFEEELLIEEPEAEPLPSAPEEEAEEMALDLGDLGMEEEVEETEIPDEIAEIDAEDLTLEMTKESLDDSAGPVGDEVQDITGDGEISALDDLGIGSEEGDELADLDMEMIETGFEELGAEAGDQSSAVFENLEESEFDLTDLDVSGQASQETFDLGDLEISSEEISLEETSPGDEVDLTAVSDIETDSGIDLDALDSIELEMDEADKAPEGDEIELNLEDLKVNETGELEIGSLSQTPEPEGEEILEELTLEDEATVIATAPEPSLEYEELTLEQEDDEAKPSEFDMEGLEETPIELDEISLSEESLEPSGTPKESELSFDLENLDLELELEEEESEEDKK